MAEYESSVVPMIEANYDRFTEVEKTVADFFITNVKSMDFSAKSIARILHVSEASLSRFAKKMGYGGYREFIYHYRPTVGFPPVHVGEQSQKVLDAYQELLNKTYNLIDEGQIRRIVAMMAEKRRIFVYGFGNSGLAAQEFRLRFLRLGLDVEAITEFHELMINAVRLNADCLVMGISLSGATREIIEALIEAQKAGAATVFVTSHNRGRYQERFDEVVLAAVKKNLEYGNVISPQFPILVLLDILYAQYLEEKASDKGEETGTALWEKIKTYHQTSTNIQ